MNGWKGSGQKDWDIAGKATSTKVRTEKGTQISVAKTFISQENWGVTSPHAKIPLKGHIHMNLTLREARPFMSFLSRDLSYIRYHLYFPSPWEKV